MGVVRYYDPVERKIRQPPAVDDLTSEYLLAQVAIVDNGYEVDRGFLQRQKCDFSQIGCSEKNYAPDSL